MSRIRLDGPRGNRVLTTLKFMRDPYDCYAKWKQQFGQTFLVKALNGDVVVTCNPENIRRIFACPGDSVGQFAVETAKPLMGSSSVILVDGESHRRQRSAIGPSFRGELIAGKASEIYDVALRIGEDWKSGQTIPIMEPALEVSLEVIIRIVFGVQDQTRVDIYKRKIKKFVSSFHPVLAFSKLLQRPLFGLSPWSRFVAARDELYTLLDEDIDARLGCPYTESNLLGRLANMKDESGEEWKVKTIRDQLVTMLLAGHETTQIAIAWAMSWLHRNPTILENLRCELSTANDLDEMLKNQLLEGVCLESLRLNSVVSDLVRTLREPLELCEMRVEAGTNVGVAICLVHEDPELYPDPKSFLPDRWADRSYKPNEFMPFGGGVRRCIGASLAMLEMKTVVAAWVKNFRFELPDDAPATEATYRRNITMAPKSGIPLTFAGTVPAK